jgi:uncharacterized protein YbcI
MPESGRDHHRDVQAVGTEITRLHREKFGRGATTTRVIAQRNVLMVLLEDIYTPVERTLIEAGNWEQVKETRDAFQAAMREIFTEVVERNMGRRVAAFMSQVHLDPDLAAEIFVLEESQAESAEAPVPVR